MRPVPGSMVIRAASTPSLYGRPVAASFALALALFVKTWNANGCPALPVTQVLLTILSSSVELLRACKS